MRIFFVLCFILSSSVVATASENFILRTDTKASAQALQIPSEGLHIVWWNIGCRSKLNTPERNLSNSQDFSPKSLNKNLSKLMDSEIKPDILILGEFCPKHFNKPLYTKIKNNYKSEYKLNKTNPIYKMRSGLRVFSRFKLKKEKSLVLQENNFHESETLKNCESNLKEKSPLLFKKGFWKRALPILKFQWKNKTYRIAPTHLANPWNVIASCKSKGTAGIHLIFNSQNPNAFQADQITRDLSDIENLLLLGDFNTPKSFFGVKGYGYSQIKNHFGPSLISERSYTYIDTMSPAKSVSIDHAFSKDLETGHAVVWPLAGSDHLPISIVIEATDNSFSTFKSREI